VLPRPVWRAAHPSALETTHIDRTDCALGYHYRLLIFPAVASAKGIYQQERVPVRAWEPRVSELYSKPLLLTRNYRR